MLYYNPNAPTQPLNCAKHMCVPSYTPLSRVPTSCLTIYQLQSRAFLPHIPNTPSTLNPETLKSLHPQPQPHPPPPM